MITAGNFSFSETEIEGLYIVEQKCFGDDRGFFMETYHKSSFEAAGFIYEFVQDNHSLSEKGVLRGLHFQRIHPQAKLVRVIRGTIFDVAVDLRYHSSTYGRWIGAYLSDKNRRQTLIPRGFAHGFLVVSDVAEVVYKCDDLYDADDESGILWNDPNIGIVWPDVGPIILSEKDRRHPTLSEAKIAFGFSAGGRLSAHE